MIGAAYVNILTKNLQSSAQKIGMTMSQFIYQQTNDSKHKAGGVAKAFFEENEIDFLERPAQSSGLNPIKYSQSYLNEKVSCTERKRKWN